MVYGQLVDNTIIYDIQVTVTTIHFIITAVTAV